MSPSSGAARATPRPTRLIPTVAGLVLLGLALLLLATSALGGGVGTAAPLGPCDAPTDPIACENSQPGNPESEWLTTGGGLGDPSIRGFATEMSVDQGETISFKIKTPATSYQIHIYRLGYYQGNGARKVATISPSAPLPQTQPACLSEPSTGLVDCGNWAVSASWTVPSDAVSGIYIARPERPDGRDSHIVFVVRDDDGGSDLLVQTSDATWQAYNDWGGNSLYSGSPAGRAYKVSYNRPLDPTNTSTYLFTSEYPMVRWLEANGYDVSYTSGIDTARRGAEILEHKAFLSVGHDEYWSAEARANVEAARDAGINLAFFSGNEIFWKTRWENSVDSSHAAYRTMVCYKETQTGTKIDPSPIWTGTWRDPRFSPPSDGGRPENALTGTIFMVNANRDDPMHVPAEYGKLRFWRNTSIASLAPGQTAVLPQGVLGYEWDSDLDNGSRPPGLIRLSETTMVVDTLLLDHGSTYGTGPATHNLTLYRASSGALVFGAGTVQWSWGLDENHSLSGTPTDARMKQATVNLFADMDVQPATLEAGLVPATKSTDTSAPSSTITTPSAGSSFPGGQAVTIGGTASDPGGGVVAGVEVSVDDGTTWHPATGRESWTYTWNVKGNGAVTIRSRAIDDSGNIGSPSAGVGVTVSCPCSLWDPTTTPLTPAAADGAAVELGVKFRADTAGSITGVRFYKGPGNTGTHVGSVWTTSGTLLGRATFSGETGGGWQEVAFDSPIEVSANTTYVASYHAPNGHFALNTLYFATPYDSPPLHAPASAAAGGNGVYAYSASPTYPAGTFNSSNYWVDVAFVPDAPDPDPPTVTSVTPTAGSTDFSTIGDLTATFSEGMTASTINATTFTLRTGSTTVAGTVLYSSATRTATLDPTTSLAPSTLYTATLKGGAAGVKDKAGNPLVSDYSWSFTTGTGPTCPCSLWSAAATPGTPSSSADTAAVEVGVKFRADVDGWVSALRFYKGGGNTGTHVGSLWSSTGELLGRATFTDESLSGWQQVSLASPVPISSDTVYVASYHAPNGNFALDRDYFANAHDNGFLHAPANGPSGGNGVYAYGSSPTFPGGSFGASNYWVDVVFTAAPPDGTPPSVTSVTPSAGSTGFSTIGDLTATFGEIMTASTINATTFTLRTGSTTVAGTVLYSSATRTATLDPTTSLAPSTLYTATLKGGAAGVKDKAGNPLVSDYSWSFTTGTGPTCPCSLWSGSTTPGTTSTGDPAAVELGVKFTADVDGSITGLRFYKGPGNTGTHVGSLWTNNGALLGRATFTDETASGWQQVTFASPVAITADTTYVASYHAPNGNFAVDLGYFGASYVNGFLRAPSSASAGGNGLYAYGATPSFPGSSYGASNYWVDVVFTAAAPNPTLPVVTSESPSPGATEVSTTTDATATFSEAMDASTIGASTFVLHDAGGAQVSAAVSYNAATRTASLDPSGQLTPNTTYTATVRGGTTGVKDAGGDLMSGDHAWSFTTAAGAVCPCTLWGSTPPGTPSSDDPGSVELGVKFKADLDGSIAGIRFYKGVGNSGTHVGSLWSSTGALLAQATFSDETASGWQQVTFTSPVAITADTTYVASYHAPNGHYTASTNYFALGYDNAPLHAPSSGLAGGNGVYVYGATPAFPSSTYGASNYWVDVVFDSGPADTAPPTVTSVTPGVDATEVSATTGVTASFSEPMDAATVTATSVILRDAGGTAVAASVSYDSTTRTVTLQPTSQLGWSTTYTATVKGSSTGVKDRAGNPLATDHAWSFTTADGAVCPCSLWSDATTPETTSSGDPGAVELGLKFTADTDGSIAGLRFYKGPGNSGTHVGSLWTGDGTLLARATFSGESASGWQTVTFDSAVAITAGTTYVASYHAPNGNYSVNLNYFALAYDNAPLHAPSSALAGGNGLYAYSPSPAFPASSYGASNYWVDVVFVPSGS